LQDAKQCFADQSDDVKKQEGTKTAINESADCNLTRSDMPTIQKKFSALDEKSANDGRIVYGGVTGKTKAKVSDPDITKIMHNLPSKPENDKGVRNTPSKKHR
jgi:hypothetical protein